MEYKKLAFYMQICLRFLRLHYIVLNSDKYFNVYSKNDPNYYSENNIADLSNRYDSDFSSIDTPHCSSSIYENASFSYAKGDIDDLSGVSNHNKKSNVPVVALLVHKITGKTIAIAHNHSNNPLLHAEIVVMSKVSAKYLSDYDLFVTLQPCKMCEHAIFLKKVNRVVFGAYRDFFSDNFINKWIAGKNFLRQSMVVDYCYDRQVSNVNVTASHTYSGNYRNDAFFKRMSYQEYIGGICEEECSIVVKNFFKKIRKYKNN